MIDPFAPRAGEALARGLTDRSTAVVIVDEAAHLPPSIAEVLAATSANARVVVAAAAGDVLRSFHGVLSRARGARSGLLLGAVASGDSEVFGVRLGPAPRGPAGRGWLVAYGRVAAVQLADPHPADKDPGSTDQDRRTTVAASP